MLEKLKSRARALKNEALAVYYVAKDPRTPWYAKAVAFLTTAYAFSPIDLIPDFIPILGYLDDLFIVPAGIALAIRLIPAEVLEEARGKVTSSGLERGAAVGAGLVIFMWLVSLIGVITLIKILSK